ncbi:hypothetical protein D6D24_07349 [Aureobasidium pullulans]|uniref:Inner centromere protein ARK-binding domain-containing protein n=1 Tax=Aureobasidium pullulans TaxID=5580 RepID=A0A4S8VJQ9_AURPU|nr:hypothetical protein D6D24_07349 [Aureobasidium pullulans]
MAPRFKTAPVGSSQWIQTERDQAAEFVDMEVEEFGYAAQNEMEWLNEHMAEIFSSNPVSFADIFKTPGKLRGKTPRTARKNAARAPLTDLFAPNPQSTFSPAPKNDFYSKVAQFQIAQDADQERPRSGTSRRSPLRVGKENTDSGYHGMTEDEMDVDSQQSMIKNSHAQAPDLEPLQEHVTNDPVVNDTASFVSANEDAENVAENVAENDDQATVPDPESSSRPVTQDSNAPFADENWQAEEAQEEIDMADEEELEEEDENAKSPSDTSTPDKPLTRKSSLTFAALPAREPLTAKRSIGPRGSHMDAFGGARTSALGKSFGIAQQGPSQPADEADEHNKTSTQRLHERITLLGQQKEPRTSKSIHMPTYPSLPAHEHRSTAGASQENMPGDTQPLVDDDDDWIAPIRTSSRAASGVDTQKLNDQVSDPASVEEAQPAFTGIPKPALRESPSKYFMGHHKSNSTATLASPAKVATAPYHAHHQKNTSVSNPNFPPTVGASTPTASPLASPAKQKFADAPISASKAKFYSVIKSAKGMFGSSAAASAHAKMGSLSSPRPLSAATFERPDPDMSRMPGGLYPDLGQNRPATALAATGGSRRTRSSTEHARKNKDEQSAMDDLERVRQQEAQKAHEKAEKEKAAEAARLEKERLAAAARPGAASQQSWRSTADEGSDVDETGPPVLPKTGAPAGKLRAPGRLAKPSRLGSIQPKPAPVSIKVASGSQRLGSTQPGSSSQDTSVAPPTRQQPSRAGSAQPPTLSKSVGAGAGSVRSVKALEAAARKKEQDEKVAQKKAEQKREIERKRAAKAEEDRKAEQERKAAEQQRLQEIRIAAQKQAEQRKIEQQRQVALQQKKSAELAATLEQERLEKQQAQSTLPRGDIGGTLRQLSKQDRPAPQANTAKPAKRPLQQDSEESSQRPTIGRAPASYQQQGDKRRKTLEGEDDEVDRPSDNALTAPPKRPSNMRKESTLNKFPHGYTHAPPPAAHHSQNMLKATVTAQHYAQHAKAGMHPNDMMKLSTARIPFAENSNPPGASSSKGPPPSAFKTPGRPAAQVISKKSVPKSAKSSPLYPNGDNINLPEIATDSEDEDSDDDQTGGFRAPSWVASPALRDLLTQQQLVDPESIFGPIAPLQMEEVFRNSKNPERLKKFRERGSSARWVDTGDAVTKEEKVKDREMRARVVKEGGWRFGQDA